MNEVIHEYKNLIHPNDKKKILLNDLFVQVRQASDYAFKFQMAMTGGVSLQILEDIFPMEDFENPADRPDIVLMLAVMKFRPINKACIAVLDPGDILAPSQVEPRLRTILGRTAPSPATLEYIQSPVSEDCVWIDTHQQHIRLCNTMNVKSLDHDLAIMLREGMLAIPASKEGKQSWSTISALCNDDPKENRVVKAAILRKVYEGFVKQRPMTYKCYREMILKVTGLSLKELKKLYKGTASGPHNRMILVFDDKRHFPAKVVDFVKEERWYRKQIKKKSRLLDWEHLPQIRAQIFHPNVPYYHKVYSEGWKSALKDLTPKLTRNYNFALEQLELRRELNDTVQAKNDLLVVRGNLQSVDLHHFGVKTFDALAKFVKKQMDEWNNGKPMMAAKSKANAQVIQNVYAGRNSITDERVVAAVKFGMTQVGMAVLNDFCDSPFNNCGYDFIIEPHHFGGSDVEQIFEAWNQGVESSGEVCLVTQLEDSINKFTTDLQANLKAYPTHDLLRYIHSKRANVSPLQLMLAGRANTLLRKLNSHKSSPIFRGRTSITFGKSAFKGFVTPYLNKDYERKDRPNEPDTSIWLELELGDRKPHHLPFLNVRMYTELYLPGTCNKQCVPFRTRRYETDSTYREHASLTQEQRAYLANLPTKERKSLARVLKAHNAAAAGTLPLVKQHDMSITITQYEDKYLARIAVKSKIPVMGEPEYKLGDTVVGWDQNQTASNSYSVLKVVEENSTDSHPWQGVSVLSVETGPITSFTKTGGAIPRDIDQLSYAGLPYNEYQAWRNLAIAFLKRHPSYTRKDGVVRNELTRFFGMSNWEPALYRFNQEYAYSLTKLMRGKKDNELKEFRREILRFLAATPGSLSIMRLSSLDYSSFDCIKRCKGLIAAYFSAILGSKSKDEEKQEADPEMFNLRLALEAKRKQKGKEKTDRVCNFLIQKSKEHNANTLKCEGDLSSKGSKKNSKKQNSRNMEWLERAIFHRMEDFCKKHCKYLLGILSRNTSHMDPFEHSTKSPKMKCRYSLVDVNKIWDGDLKCLERYLNYSQKDKGTARYYRQGVQDFISHYGLQPITAQLAKGKICPQELTDLLTKNQYVVAMGGKVLMPRRGGRFYLSTHCCTTGATEMKFNNQNLWLSDSDQIAALNINLATTPSRKKKTDTQ